MPAAPSAARITYALTDCGNAERLRDQYGESIRFCRVHRKWLAWDGIKWVADRGSVVQLAKRTIREMRRESGHLLRFRDDHDRAPDADLLGRSAALVKWSIRSEQANNINGMLKMAESEPAIATLPDNFDRDPWLLNLRNGTLELKSGHFREHRPQDMITKAAAIDYCESATCPRWARFLSEIFRSDLKLISFLQRAIGYSLTGDTSEECVFVLCGNGRNGKSTLVNVLHSLLGEYAGLVEMDTLLESRRSGPQEDIADLSGRRLISAQEPRLNARLDSSLLKWLTGGDLLRARRLYGHAFEFQPVHKLWLCVNRFPPMPADDPALWSRVKIIPFDVSFAGREDRSLKRALLTERQGILRWAIAGCKSWQKSGLACPLAVTRATQNWRNEQRKWAV